MKKLTYMYVLFLLALLVGGCGSDHVSTPKPKGYSRLYFPDKQYRLYDADAPYSFEYPVYATLSNDRDKNAQKWWKNLNFTQFNGVLHLTYYENFSAKDYNEMTENARVLAMKHTIKADLIDQKRINYPDKKVYGIYYSIEGNTASSVQFFLTDSLHHYLRGALYFNERPQYDSIQPVINFIKQDIDKMIATFKWKK
ncbi:gliding motility lipoprotein GldD [Pedobacter montanisoli]|uniref:Gliding motility lipoprotein GldD n=1 Tax=Pedobacter montanisoli TaxID=2923277 RepID=A0ABS9ZSW2_9SPHI|nr:gliding motility lipoprotein GldD [Pedobacter montanisoli]MCJ0741588.1 gliding motility lipoprotein GldD [Pedobacter montanisoli]